MFYSYNYFRQYNNNEEIKDYKEFYKQFSNTREFGGDYRNIDHLIKNRYQNTLGHMYNIILRKQPKNILDIGCGDGVNLPLANLFQMIEYHGIDYAEKTIEAAKKDYPNINFKVGDAFKLPYKDQEFDMAILSSVLILYKKESDRITLLNEAFRVLKKDGILVINVWNDTFVLRNSIKLAQIIGRLNKDKLPKDFMGCHFNQKDVRKMIAKTNFSISERICTAQLWGLVETIQYLNRKKYHRDFGNEKNKRKNLPQNIKKDVFLTVGGANKLLNEIMWKIYKINPNCFSWMNIYVLEKKED